MIDSILLVCEGNVCRSPMAQGMFAKRLPTVRVTSAGLGALVGRRPDPIAIQLMAERDIDISHHRAADVNLQYVRSAQLVLVMTQVQRRMLEASYPFSKGKVYRLGEHERVDVMDPYRQGREVFERCLNQIEQGLSRWFDAIVRLTN